MFAGIMGFLGGLGLFLFGMTLMTVALRALADDRLRNLLARSASSPLKGVATGALSTAVVQSSGATTVAAVGFVGAGLLTFSQSLGIVFGASVGTTITGWIVALVGFKLDMGQMLMPLVFAGALMRLTGRGRLEQAGTAIAGFGLIFIGIDFLQQGLTGMENDLTPAQFPSDTIVGRLLLAVIGLVLTVILQSSSASVAMALAAVHIGTITLNQAAAMVVGMQIGSSSTAAFATIGGNAHARRTGFAHVIFNSLTAAAAFLLLTPYMDAVEALFPGARTKEPEFVLVGFHTLFNILGVVAVLPFTNQFANMVIRLFPERGNPLVGQLNRSLLSHPPVAIAAVGGTLWDITMAALGELKHRLRDVTAIPDVLLMNDITDAIEQTNTYLEELATHFRSERPLHDYVAFMHVLDHLRRIDGRMREDRRLRRCRDDALLAAMSDRLIAAADIVSGTTRPVPVEQAERIHAINRELKTAMRQYRANAVAESSERKLTVSDTIYRMDTARSLRRIAYHIWRIAYHLIEPQPETPPATSEAPAK